MPRIRQEAAFPAKEIRDRSLFPSQLTVDTRNTAPMTPITAEPTCKSGYGSAETSLIELSSTDEKSSDLDGVGSIPYFRANHADKTCRSFPTHKYLITAPVTSHKLPRIVNSFRNKHKS
jgi:hypothetical protein